jgi:prolipoprotein diacylglyceryltransferase
VHFSEKGHEYTGVPTYGPDGSALFLYPTQMIESLTMFAVFGFLVWLHRHKKFDGQVLIRIRLHLRHHPIPDRISP